MAEDDAAGGGQPLARDEALELLALSEAIARKVYRDFGYPGAAGSRRNPAAAHADSSSRAPNASTGPSAPAARTPSVAVLPAAQARTSAVNE